jgi:hypothetical protein
MFSFIARCRTITPLVTAAVLCASVLSPQRAAATEVVPLSLTETIRQAETIVVGRVVSQNTRWGTEAKRWMQTDYSIAVEEVVEADAGTEPIGKTVVVTYWGGTLDGETQGVSDCRLPRIGERLVFILARGWQTKTSVSPVVGFNYGLLSVAAAENDGPAVVLDANGTPLVRRADGLLGWRGATPAAEANSARVELPQFTSWVRENIRTLKAAPSELPPQSDAKPEPSDPRGMPMFHKTPYDEAAGDRQPVPTGPGVLPLEASAASEVATSTTAGGGPVLDYNFGPIANRFITVNNFRSTMTPWSPVDQQLLAHWNHYADIYRVYANPTGTYAWRDNVFDLAGFLSSAQLQATYGVTWPADVIAYCFFRGPNDTTPSPIVESDIVLNSALAFTLDDESVYNGGTAISFRQVMLHEMGHMWGLNHNFNFLSIMNDSQLVYRFFGFPYMDDAEAIRAAYPTAVMARTDLAIYLRYSVTTQFIAQASFPSSVPAGGSFTVNNYHVENVGTTTIATPTVEWYLTPARNFGTSYFLGSTTYGSLNRFQYHTPTDVARSLTVPANVPVGQYYLAAFIRNDTSPQQSGFPFNNDTSFSRTMLSVTAGQGSLQVTINPAGAVSAGAQWQVNGGAWQNSGATVSGLTAGNHTVAFKPITAWTTPANQTVTVTANNTATTSGTYVVQSGSLQVTITPAGAVSAGAQWSVDGGPYQNSGATVSNLYVGTHTLTFKPVSGWETPASQSVSVSANTTTNASGNYGTIASTGSLQVTISPAGAVSAGAQWQVDGGSFQNGGATVSNLSVGNHTVSFKSVTGWTTPANQTISVAANSTSTTTGTYVAVPQTGSLQVTIAPAGAISAGAQWQVNGGAFQNSGATVSGLSVGNHTVAFKSVSGWSTPSNQTISVTANTTSSTTGTYTAVPSTGSLQVSIFPAAAVNGGAQWQVNGGAFQNSGATVSGLSVGNHTVSFKPLSGWTTPSDQVISVSASTTSSTTGSYIAPPLQRLGVSSTKAHGTSGTFGINLPLTGTPGVECRTGGASGNHTLIFTFSNNITGGSATVTSGVGSVSGALGFAGNTVTVQLTGVTNAQRLTVNLSNITDGYGQVLQTTPVTVGFLVGDTNGSGNVNATDIGQTKAGSGQAVSASNFRQDPNVSGGSINASDVGLVKAAAGTQLPPL